jgi:hypothetical protein
MAFSGDQRTRYGQFVVQSQPTTYAGKTLAAVTVLSAAMRTELQKVNPKVVAGFEIDLPGGTKRYSMSGQASASRGHFEGKILSFGPITRRIADRRNNLENFQSAIEIDDKDFELSILLAGPNGNNVRGSAARIVLMSTNVDNSAAFTYFEGRILSPKATSSLSYIVPFVPNNTPLEKYFPKHSINQFDWPNADSDALGRYVPLVYGQHDSTGVTNEGMVKAFKVDSVNFKYLLSLGYLKSVDRVYSAKTLKTVTSDYTIENPIVNGKQFTIINFVADQTDNAITADVKGYETLGDGTGTLIDDPVDQLKHLLVNFVWGDYSAGTWLPDVSAPIDTVRFTETKTFLAALNFEASRNIFDTQRKGIQVLNEWLDNHRVKGFWAKPGKLAIRPDDPFTEDIYIDDPWVRWNYHQQGQDMPPLDVDDLNVLDRVDISFLYDSANGKFNRTLVVEDPSVVEGVSENIQYFWSAARNQ